MPKWTKKEDIERILKVAHRRKNAATVFNIPDKLIYPDRYINRNCPVCGGDKKTDMDGRGRKSPTSQGWYFLKYEDAKCDACGFCYSANIPEPDYINSYYRYAVARTGDDADVQNRIDVIRRYVSRGKSILEFGAGFKGFVRLLNEAGYEADGVDIDDEIIKDEYYAICCYYTLEHLVSPTEILKIFRELLEPEGILIIEVPDYEKYPNESMHFQHLNHFTKHHLERLLDDNGFKTIETIDAHSRYFGFASISTTP